MPGVIEPSYRLVRGPARPVSRPALDPAQRAVVDHDGGPLLVLAGPGTGKTTTLVEAVVERIAGRGIDPESVLMLTFSRKAAADLRERVTARLRRTTREPLARTFHSYAFGLLRQHAFAHDEPTPRLLSGPEQDLVIRELLRGDAEGDGVEWPESLRPALLTRGFAEELRDLLLRAVERGVSPRELAGYGSRYDRPDWPAAARFLRQYLEVTALSGSTAYDPAELIRAAIGTLREDRDLLARERSRRRYVFVDEYQDTDPAQAELLRLIAGGAAELVVVGDPDQSIYGFRGADPDGIRRFADRFTDGDDDVPSLALRTTRRCGSTLLGASRRIAARLAGPVGHRDLTAVPEADPGRVEVHVLPTPGDEAAYIAHRLRRAHLLDGVPWRDMAVLVRSTTRTLPTLRRALSSAGVPLAVSGEELPLVVQPGVVPLLVLLRCALRPDTLDGEAAIQLLASPLGGADALDLRRLRRALRDVELAVGGRRGYGDLGELLAEALHDPLILNLVPDDVAVPAQRVADLLAATRNAAAVPAATAEDVLWAAWSASGLAEQWQQDSVRGGPVGAAADRDLDAVVALFDAAARFVDRLPRSGPAVFLEHVAGQQIPGDTLAARAPSGDAVRLLTAHAAKGLEWGLVAVAGVQEGVWPDLRRRGSLLGSELLVDLAAGRDPVSAQSPASLLDEERRLFYVAVTRARHTLLVTAVRGEEDQPSRFLDELDPVDPGQVRAFTKVPRTLSLPAVVAELRDVVTDPAQHAGRRQAAAGQLARLATQGVPGAHPEEWWGLAPLSDAEPLRRPDESVPVSPSQVEKFDTCELRWLLEAAGGTSSRALGAAVGNVIHELAAEQATLGEGDQVDRDALATALDTALDTLDLGAPWAGRRERERAHRMLGKFLAWLGASRGRWSLVGVEVPFEVKVGPRAVVRGRVDRLERDDQGRYVVVDLKTGKSAPNAADVETHSQLGVYQLAVELSGFPGATRSGGAALVQLGGDAAAHKEQAQVPLEDSPEPGWAHDLVERVADGMSGAVFQARTSSTCRICPVKTSCPAQGDGRQVGG